MKATLNLSGKAATAVNLVDDEVNSPAPMVKTAVGAKVCNRVRLGEYNASVGLRCVYRKEGAQPSELMRQGLNAQGHVDAMQKPAAGGRGKKPEGGAAKNPGDYTYCKRVSACRMVRRHTP